MSEKSGERCLSCEMMMSCLDRVLKGSDMADAPILRPSKPPSPPERGRTMDNQYSSLIRQYLTYEKLQAIASVEPSVLTDVERKRLDRARAIPEEQRNLLRHIGEEMEHIVLSAERVHDLISDYLEGEDMTDWKDERCL